MECDACEQKMKCIYSVPVRQNARYRVYKCKHCKRLEMTLEVTTTIIEAPEIKKIITDAENNRLQSLAKFAFRKKKKG